MSRPNLLSSLFSLCVVSAIPSAQADTAIITPVPLVGAPCEGCEAAFDGIPAKIPTRLVLRRPDEPGTPLTLKGRITDRDGKPRSDVVLYLHQTDASGAYPPFPATTPSIGREARRHGRLRGWVRSDGDGHYQIDTVRPGSYPGTDIPEHIHMQVIEPGCATYLIDDVMFRDDPRLTPKQERHLAKGAGGAGVVTPRMVAGTWHAERPIVTGKGIPGYPECPPTHP